MDNTLRSRQPMVGSILTHSRKLLKRSGTSPKSQAAVSFCRNNSFCAANGAFGSIGVASTVCKRWTSCGGSFKDFSGSSCAWTPAAKTNTRQAANLRPSRASFIRYMGNPLMTHSTSMRNSRSAKRFLAS